MVEDQPFDAALFEMALADSELNWDLRITNHGDQAEEFILSSTEIPELVFLDLQLPGLSGFEVLKILRAKQEWRNIPVYILTTSSWYSDIEKARILGANQLFCKPPKVRELVDILQTAEAALGA